MNPELAKQLVLGYGWDAAERRRVSAALRLVEQDPDCAAAAADYDRIRAALTGAIGRDQDGSGGEHGNRPESGLDQKNRDPGSASDDREEAADNERPERGCASDDQPEAVADDRLDVPEGGWAAFESRLARAVSRRRWRRAWRQPGLIAAALLLGVFLGWGALPRSAGPNLAGGRLPAADARRPGSPTAELAFSPSEINSRVSAFRQIADVFDQRTSWVALTKGASDLGLAADPSSQPGELMLLRLALVRGSSVVSQTDVVIVPGQDAELTLPLEGGESVRYLLATSAEDPARLNIYAELRGRHRPDQALAAVGSDLRVRPGEVCAAGQMLTQQGEYGVAVASALAGKGGPK